MSLAAKAIIGVCVFASLCCVGWADTHYVATTGSDSYLGTSSQPWRTLQHAVDSIAPGDTIIVRAGTYAGCRITGSGTASAVCTLKAADDATVLVNAPGSQCVHNSIIEVESWSGTVRYWVIDGLELCNAVRYGVDLRDTEHVTVQNCYVHDNGVTGIFTAFTYHPTIQYNESAYNGEHGIYQSNSGDYPTIRGNLLHHNYGCGIHMNGDLSMGGDGQISYVTVEGNKIWENGTGGGSAINGDGVSDGIIRNNLCYSNHASGISLYAIDGAQGSSRNRVYNNTIVVPSDGRWAVNIPASSERTNPISNEVINNILYSYHSWRGAISIYGSAALAISDYNVVVDRMSNDDGNTTMTLAQWQALGFDQHSLLSTPSVLFGDAANDDYALGEVSPAIDAGCELAAVAVDIAQVPRPQGWATDIGCYEMENLDSIGLYRGETSGFYLRNANASGVADAKFGFGAPGAGWLPLAGDWDADGDDTAGLYSQSTATFYLRNANAGGYADISFRFGPSGASWLPLSGDWDGDGEDTVGVYDPIGGRFYLRNSHAGGLADVSFGFGPKSTNWQPIAGDWDGDGTDNIGLYDPVGGRFYLRNVHAGGSADVSLSFGPKSSTWLPLAGDWDSDETDTVGLYAPSSSTFYLRNAHAGGNADISFRFGPAPSTWLPIAGNWDPM